MVDKTHKEMADDVRNLLTEISVAYYQDGATQEEISKKFAISRAKVGRLLRQAREEGVVEITVYPSNLKMLGSARMACFTGKATI